MANGGGGYDGEWYMGFQHGKVGCGGAVAGAFDSELASEISTAPAWEALAR